MQPKKKSHLALGLVLAGLAMMAAAYLIPKLAARDPEPELPPLDYGINQRMPADLVPSQLEALFAAEVETGIPLEALGGLSMARCGTLEEVWEAAGTLAPPSDTTVPMPEQAQACVAALGEGGLAEEALAQSRSLELLGRIRREKIYPLPLDIRSDFEDGWGDARKGENGARPHEGTDIFADHGTPIYSVCDGVVEKKGWLQLGGWRLGIRGEDGIYYYYAHMCEYADVEVGDTVKRGTVIGYVGDTGYGPEGTTGQFPNHLHFGMYQGRDDTEVAFNPYPYLIHWREETP